MVDNKRYAARVAVGLLIFAVGAGLASGCQSNTTDKSATPSATGGNAATAATSGKSGPTPEEVARFKANADAAAKQNQQGSDEFKKWAESHKK